MHSYMDIIKTLLELLQHAAGLGGGLPHLQVGPISDLLFFREINSFLTGEIDVYRENLLGRTASLMGAAVLSLLTLWIVIQGYRITTGQSRDSMMALVTNSLRAVLIVGVATAAAAGGGSIYKSMTDGLSSSISQMVTGNDDDVYDRIDKSLAYMQVALSSIDALDVQGDEVLNEKKDRAMWFAGIGTGGPAVMAGTMLLLNKIAMALFIGLGPLFILCLLFEQTKPLFGRWLYYGLGTMFSLAVLSVMVTLATDMVIAVAGSFWASSLLGAGPEGVSSMALQQGGMGVVLTMLIISTPPMAAMFFQGTLGNFVPYSQLSTGSAGQGAARDQMGDYRAGQYGGYGAAPMNAGKVYGERGTQDPRPDSVPNNAGTRTTGSHYTNQPDTIRTGTGSQYGVADAQQTMTPLPSGPVTGQTPLNPSQPPGSRGLYTPTSGSNTDPNRPPSGGTA